jgi:ADP-ribosyl-[dinitrogen reductase] hydrolase
MTNPRTSISHPLKIAEVKTGESCGLIGITFAPGKIQSDGMSGAWERDLGTDLDVIAEWNAAAVVTLVEGHELESMRITELGREVQRRHMEWHHWPITDVSVPTAEFEASWEANAERIRTLLRGGSNVLIHCKGGLALQLPFCFEVRTLSDRLVSSAPE